MNRTLTNARLGLAQLTVTLEMLEQSYHDDYSLGAFDKRRPLLDSLRAIDTARDVLTGLVL